MQFESVEDKLLELGYDKSTYPKWNYKFDSMFSQPRDLTPQSTRGIDVNYFWMPHWPCVVPVWKTIQPKLEAMLEEEREDSLRRQHDTRLSQRRTEFRTIWDAFLTEIDDYERETMPTFRDTHLLPSVATMLDEDGAQIPATQERWEAIKESCLLEVEGHRSKIIRDLQMTMKKVKDGDQSDVDTEIMSDLGENAPDVLSDPAAIFSCCYNYCKQLHSYPAILHHSYVDHGVSEWKTGKHGYSAQIPAAVSMVLTAVGLPPTTTRADLDNVDGRFVCLCGHPKYRKPLTFVKLVRKLLHLSLSKSIHYPI
jgi:hypothetical protein